MQKTALVLFGLPRQVTFTQLALHIFTAPRITKNLASVHLYSYQEQNTRRQGFFISFNNLEPRIARHGTKKRKINSP